MTTPAARTDAIEMLGRLAVLGMGMAERLHDAAQATDDRDALARIGTAFHHISRGVRQSLALEVRFAAGWTPAVRAAEPAPAAPQPPHAPARERPESVGWNEYERLDCEELVDELDRLADGPEDEPIDAERLEAALEAGVARLRRGVLALKPRPKPLLAAATSRPASRARLLAGAATLRVVDSS